MIQCTCIYNQTAQNIKNIRKDVTQDKFYQQYHLHMKQNLVYPRAITFPEVQNSTATLLTQTKNLVTNQSNFLVNLF